MADLVVLVIAPEGGIVRSVHCADTRQAITVVVEESRFAVPMTIFIVSSLGKDGRSAPVDRWGISKDGDLIHSPYKKRKSL